MAKMITEDRKKPTGKRVLLFSGGMDSVMMMHLLKPDVVLVIPHGQKYENNELVRLQQMVNKGYINAELVVDPSLALLGKHERDDAIIPGRNSLFVTVAAMYGELIYFGSVYGDRSKDKDLRFFEMSTDLLNHMYSEQHWCEEHQFQVVAPYKGVTKAELVATFLAEGGDPELILTSYSCYEGGDQHCGTCKPCFRKWVAMACNGMDIPEDYFTVPPRLAPWLAELLPTIKEHKWRGREDRNILKALEL